MKNKGFTLIELMVVIAIVAILAAIAIPSYQNQVQKTRRADAQAELLNSAQLLERCFTTENSYVGDSCPNFPRSSEDGFYEITAPTLSATEFKLVATPQGAQSQDGGCTQLSIDQLGRKKSIGTADDCWGS